MYFKANVLVFVPTKKTTTAMTMMMMSLCIIISISLFVIAHCGPIRLED
jgi:preprotein translocase subunit SecE